MSENCQACGARQALYTSPEDHRTRLCGPCLTSVQQRRITAAEDEREARFARDVRRLRVARA